VAAVAITWECLSNLVGEEAFSARLALRNLSDAPIAAGWTLYFNTCRRVLADSVDAGWRIDHLNGDLFRLRSTGARTGCPARRSRSATTAQFWAISVTDAPLGFYLVEADGKVTDLGDPEILPFARPEQLHRHARDLLPPADAAWRYLDNASVRLLPAQDVGAITPRPRQAFFSEGRCRPGAGATLSPNPPWLAKRPSCARCWTGCRPAMARASSSPSAPSTRRAGSLSARDRTRAWCWCAAPARTACSTASRPWPS
jgi:hexosaminidase